LAKKKKSHPGFKSVAQKISQEQGIPLENANAILASSSRNASKKAKAKNPNLNKVRGKSK